MKRNTILIILIFLIKTNYKSQTTQLRYNIKIKADGASTQIQKMVKTTCTLSILQGFEVKDEYTFKNGEHTFTSTAITPTRSTPYALSREKTISVDMPLTGNANITKDDKDATILHINFWLNHKNTIDSGQTIQYETGEFDCSGNIVKTLHPVRVLSKDTITYLQKVDKIITDKWFTHAETIIKVLNQSGTTLYYLVDKYDRDGDYRLQLKNREYVSYKSSSIDLAPILIPFKFRPAVGKGRSSAAQQITSDVNLGLFIAYSYGQYKLRREGDEYKDIGGWKFTTGLFFDFGTTTLDTSSTTTADIPLGGKQTASIFVVSTGFGVTASKWDVNLGVFLGWDYGIGDYAERWNYNKKFWVGLGLGYNLSNFWKKK